MKSIIKSILLISILSIIAEYSCTNMSKEDKFANNNISGTWKLVGFVDVEKGEMKEAEPDDEWCYVLKFKEDGKLSGMSSTNSFEGMYEIDYSKSSINIFIALITYVNEYLDGELYMKSLKNADFFSLEKDVLKLYYNYGKNNLLFKE